MSGNTWTVLVYMAGDNDLSNDCVRSLKEMQKIGVGTGVKVVVKYDSAARNVPTCLFDIQSKADKKINGEKGLLEISEPVESTETTTNEGASYATSILKFVKGGIEKHKADNYMLILSGHGSAAEGTRLLYDQNPPRYVSIPRLRWALEEACGENKLAVLGFDSCAMSSVELGYEFRNVAELMVAAEGFEPSAGWPAGRILELVNAKPKPCELAEQIVSEYVAQYKDYVSAAGASVDLAATKLYKFDELVEAIKVLAEVLTKGTEDAKIKNLILLGHWYAQSYKMDEYVDLIDFCCRLVQAMKELEMCNSSIYGACEQVIRVAESSVIKSHSCGVAYQHSYGLSIYFPWFEDKKSLALTSELFPEDVWDPRELLEGLTEPIDPGAGSILDLISSSELQDDLRQRLGSPQMKLGFKSRELIAKALNQLINDTNLLQKGAFDELRRSVEGLKNEGEHRELAELLREEDLSPKEIQRLNSLLLRGTLRRREMKTGPGEPPRRVGETSRYKRLWFPAATGWARFLVSYLEETRREPRQVGAEEGRLQDSPQGTIAGADDKSPSFRSSSIGRFSPLGKYASMKNPPIESYCGPGKSDCLDEKLSNKNRSTA